MYTETNQSTAANKTANSRFYEEVINQKKLAMVDEIVATNYVNHGFLVGQPTDRNGLKQFVRAFHAAFADGHMTIDQMIAEGDTIATRLTFHGTHTGEFQGIAPTGKKVTVPALDMVRYEGGKMVEQWGGPDQMSLLPQLGVIFSSK